MITCRTAAEQLSRATDSGIGLFAWTGVRTHLLLCAACRRYRDQITAVDDAVRAHLADPPPVRLSAEAAARISAAVRAELDGDQRPRG